MTLPKGFGNRFKGGGKADPPAGGGGGGSAGRDKPKKGVSVAKVAFGVIVFIAIVVIVVNSAIVVPPGNRGVVIKAGAVEEDVILGEGMHFIMPFVEHVELMNVQVQKYEMPYQSATHELQDVTATVAVNFRLDPRVVDDVYQDYTSQYADVVLAPAISTSVKNSTPKFTAAQLVNNRVQAEQYIVDDVRQRLSVSDFLIVEQVYVTNFEFTTAYHAQVNEKAVQYEVYLTELNKLKAEQVRQNQTIVKAEAEAQAAIAQAQGRLKTAELDAQAQIALAKGESEKIRLINEELRNSPDYLQLQAIAKWNGAMPTYYGGGLMPFINIGPQDAMLAQVPN